MRSSSNDIRRGNMDTHQPCKEQVYNSCVLPAMTYAAETWTLTSHAKNKSTTHAFFQQWHTPRKHGHSPAMQRTSLQLMRSSSNDIRRGNMDTHQPCKEQVYNSCVLPAMTYAAETWTLTSHAKNKSTTHAFFQQWHTPRKHGHSPAMQRTSLQLMRSSSNDIRRGNMDTHQPCKEQVYNSCVLPAMTYAAETWTLTSHAKNKSTTHAFFQQWHTTRIHGHSPAMQRTSLLLMRSSSNDIRRGNMGTHQPSKEQVYYSCVLPAMTYSAETWTLTTHAKNKSTTHAFFQQWHTARIHGHSPAKQRTSLLLMRSSSNDIRRGNMGTHQPSKEQVYYSCVLPAMTYAADTWALTSQAKNKSTTHAFFQQWHTPRKHGHSPAKQRTSLLLMRSSSNDIRRGNMGTHQPSKEQVYYSCVLPAMTYAAETWALTSQAKNKSTTHAFFQLWHTTRNHGHSPAKQRTSLLLMRSSSNDIRRGNMGTHQPSKEQVYNSCVLPAMTYDAETWALTSQAKNKSTTHAFFQQWHTPRKHGHSPAKQRTSLQLMRSSSYDIRRGNMGTHQPCKEQVYNSCVLPAMTYAAETWALTSQAKNKSTTHAFFQQWHTPRKHGHSPAMQRTSLQLMRSSSYDIQRGNMGTHQPSKEQVYNSCVLPAMTYDAETWALTTQAKNKSTTHAFFQLWHTTRKHGHSPAMQRTSLLLMRSSSNDIQRGNMGTHQPSKEQASSRTTQMERNMLNIAYRDRRKTNMGKRKDQGHRRDWNTEVDLGRTRLQITAYHHLETPKIPRGKPTTGRVPSGRG